MKKNKTVKHKGKLTPNAVLNEVDGAVKLRWKYDKQFEYWWIPNAGGGFQIMKEDLLGYELRRNNRYISNFNKLWSAKLVAELMWRG